MCTNVYKCIRVYTNIGELNRFRHVGHVQHDTLDLIDTH
jgi:hypothetical protein